MKSSGARDRDGPGRDASERIRVLHVITWMDLGGAQDHVLNLVRALDPGRFDVRVAVGSSHGERGELLERLDASVPVHRLRHLVRELSARHDAAVVGELGRLIDRVQPDIVHTHSSKAGIVGRVAAWRRPVRTVHNVHGWSYNGTDGLLRTGLVALERAVARRTDALLVVSEADLDSGERNRIRARNGTWLVRSGVDLDRFAARGAIASETADRVRRAPVSGSAPTVLIGTVGRLVDPKDPLTAVRAFAQFHRQCPQARFRWVGDGPLRGEVEAEISRLGLRDSFELAGSSRDVPTELQQFDIFVVSSIWEGLPRSLVEAVAARVPVVATDVGGIGDLIRDGETGRLVPPREPAALAAALSDVLADPGAATDRARAALDRARSEYSVQEMVRKTAEVYERLVSR